MRYILGVLSALALAGCTVSGGDATDALAAYGFKDAKLTGYALFGCGERDTFKSGFEATGPTGQRVRGVVCKGWLKGATVRITGRA